MNPLHGLKERLFRCCPTLEMRENEPMSRHTSFRIGGPVSLMALPKTEEETAAALDAAAQQGVTPLVVGNGSNLLAPDEGLSAFVIKCLDGLGQITPLGEGTVRLGSGLLLARAALYARDHSLTGLEFAHGIPGSVGGGVMMNAGAYFGEMSQVVRSVRYLTFSGEHRELSGEALGFSYRKSVFEGEACLILSADVVLAPGEKDKISERISDLARRRKERQPLEFPSAGSAFKRPGEGQFAAALIDGCGLKGLRVGDAQVSEKHAGFVINRGQATCKDVMELMEQVHRRVLDETGVALKPEVKLLGGTTWNF